MNFKIVQIGISAILASGIGLVSFVVLAAAPTAPPSVVPTIAPSANTGLVLRDQTSLRSAPSDSSQVHAVLSAGDLMEVRGARLDYLQVYDHKRERAGFVRASSIKRLSMSTDEAPELATVVQFLHNHVGSESLGIAYAAAFLKVASPNQRNSKTGIDVLDALGSMADRLAQRASTATAQTKGPDTNIAAHLDVVQRYGVGFNTFERDGRIQVCYDADASRQVLVMPASNEQKVRAVLAITLAQCTNPNQRLLEIMAQEKRHVDLLDALNLTEVPDYLRNRVYLRKAAAASTLVFKQAQNIQPQAVQVTGLGAINTLALVNKAELSDSDQASNHDAGIRVGAIRWAGVDVQAQSLKGGLDLSTAQGQPGETCVTLSRAKQSTVSSLVKKCTYGVIWMQSASVNSAATVLTLAVQPLAGWRELWVFRQVGDAWAIDVLPPSRQNPNFSAQDIGYIEFAGFTPDGLLVASESRVQGRYKRSFEVLSLADYSVKKQASDPSLLSAFQKWQNVVWKKTTISLR